jgi:hypothetical protein
MCTNSLKERAISINFLLNISINQKIVIFYIHRRENLNLKNFNLESVLAIVHGLSLSKKISATE